MARAAQRAPGNTAGRIGNWIWAVSILVVLFLISAPTVIIAALGMLPTTVAYLVDRGEEKFATFCVGGLNVCGVFPYLLQVWFDDHSISMALDIISDVFALVVMYAAAGFGWALFISIPPVISAFLNVIAQHRVQFLRATQKDIVDEWGQSVTDQPDAPEIEFDHEPQPSGQSDG